MGHEQKNSSQSDKGFQRIKTDVFELPHCADLPCMAIYLQCGIQLWYHWLYD